MYKLPDWIDLIDWQSVKNDTILSNIKESYHKNHLFNYYEVNGKNKDYRKFMILSTQRSGTSLLLNILRSHSNILAYSEVFYEKVRPFLYYKEIPSSLYRYAQRNPSKYLVNYFFRTYPEQVHAVGFKYMYNQLPIKKFSSVLKLFSPEKDIIIHLKRINKLKIFVSNKLLLRENKVEKLIIDENKKNMIQETIKNSFKIDPLEFIEYVKKTIQQENLYESRLKNYRVLTLFYEDLEKNPINETNKVIEALGLPYDQLYVINEKINIRPLSEIIENYDQLKNTFKHSSYSKYFDE